MPRGGTRQRARCTKHQLAEIDRMQAIGVLVGIDQAEGGAVVKMSRVREAARCSPCKPGPRSARR
jgi:hypothetical protein